MDTNTFTSTSKPLPMSAPRHTPLLRPLNETENTAINTLLAKNRWLNDALTEAKTVAGECYDELRMMRVAVQALTIRALKAEARVKNQQAELGEQEVAMLRLIQENTTRIV